MAAEIRAFTIMVNGRLHAIEIAGPPTVASAIAALGLQGKRIAVERNGVIVSRSRYGDTVLGEGDRLEIVGAVGGG